MPDRPRQLLKTLRYVVPLLLLVPSGCGLKFRGLLTPVYRIPSGYSETYLKHLERHERRTRKREWVDPSLAKIRTTAPRPHLVPQPGQNESAESNGSANRKNPPFSGSGEDDGSASR